MVSSALDSRSVDRKPLPASPALQQEVAAGHVLHSGSKGPAVVDAQRLLEAHGFSVGDKGIDGKLGKDTQAAIVKFQRSRGLEPDGAIGPDTLRQLLTPTTGVDSRRGLDRGVTPTTRDRVPGMSGEEVRRRAEVDAGRRAAERSTPTPQQGEIALAPKHMSAREKYDYYADLVKQNGGTVNAGGKPTVLGLRGMDINGNKHDTTSARSYNDTFVVLTADKKAIELKGSTHSGQVTTSLVDHVGRIDPGTYKVGSSEGEKYGKDKFRGSKQNGSTFLPAVRDLNDDGKFSAEEKRLATQRGTTQSDILFHVGTNDSPHSIGCMTMPPAVYDRFLAAVGDRGFAFTLVDAYNR